MSLRSTTTFSSGQIYCCFTRCLSVRCSMLKEMPLLRAPENKRTGMEMRPKVKCPDQTEAAIVPLVHRDATTPRPFDHKGREHFAVAVPLVILRKRSLSRSERLPTKDLCTSADTTDAADKSTGPSARKERGPQDDKQQGVTFIDRRANRLNCPELGV